MAIRNPVHDAIEICTPRTWLKLGGVSTIIIALILTTGLAEATPIHALGTGILDAGNGSVVVSGNGSTSGCINWYNSGPAPTTCPDTGATAALTVEGGSTVPFAAGQTGTIQDLSFQTVLPLVDFLVVNRLGGSSLEFDLKDIRINSGAPIGDCTAGANDPGATCTPAGSPFQLTNGLADPNNSNQVDTVSVAFTVDAWGYHDGSGTNYDQADLYIGTFTTQQAIQGATIDSLLTTIKDGGSISASWSATFTPQSTVPESATFLLFGIGLMTVGLLKRKAHRS